jgi:hypothetical protein
MARGQRELLLRYVLRDRVLFNTAKEEVRPEHLNRDGDYGLALLWQASLRVIDHYCDGKLPTDPLNSWALVEGEIEAMGESGDAQLPGPVRDYLSGPGGLLEFVFGPGPEPEYDVGEKLLIEFLRERTVVDPLCEMAQALGQHVPRDLDKSLAAIQDRGRALDAIGRSTAKSAAPDNYTPPHLDKMSTGVDFLDDIMNGGDAPTEVYGIMGGYGTGKTLLAVQACYQKSLLFQSKADQTLAPTMESCHLFHYEAGYDEILRRVWSHAGRIHQESLERMKYDGLSTRGNLKPYELELFAEEIKRLGLENVDGEEERLDKAKKLLKRGNLSLHDFSGNDPENPTAGGGYVDEIASSLRHEVSKGRKIGAVYIDYVLAACRSHLNRTNRRTEDLRHLVGGFPMECYRKISSQFGCRVYLFHQRSGASNSRSFLANYDGGDSAESKSFPENVWFNIILGNKDVETSCIRVHCSKSRRAKGVANPILVRLQGHLGTAEKADDVVIDPSLGRPVPKADMELIAKTMDMEDIVQLPNPGHTDLSETI